MTVRAREKNIEKWLSILISACPFLFFPKGRKVAYIYFWSGRRPVPLDSIYYGKWLLFNPPLYFNTSSQVRPSAALARSPIHSQRDRDLFVPHLSLPTSLHPFSLPLVSRCPLLPLSTLSPFPSSLPPPLFSLRPFSLPSLPSLHPLPLPLKWAYLFVGLTGLMELVCS